MELAFDHFLCFAIPRGKQTFLEETEISEHDEGGVGQLQPKSGHFKVIVVAMMLADDGCFLRACRVKTGLAALASSVHAHRTEESAAAQLGGAPTGSKLFWAFVPIVTKWLGGAVKTVQTSPFCSVGLQSQNSFLTI